MGGNEVRPSLDADGFLLDWREWDEACAAWLALEESIGLTEEHLEILHLLRRYYSRHEHAPAMRALVSLVRRELGAEKGRSIYLLGLFPGSPARSAARLAGLPKPPHCL
jgi:tRNA 2-thiouridine synthesizing protein E